MNALVQNRHFILDSILGSASQQALPLVVYFNYE